MVSYARTGALSRRLSRDEASTYAVRHRLPVHNLQITGVANHDEVTDGCSALPPCPLGIFHSFTVVGCHARGTFARLGRSRTPIADLACPGRPRRKGAGAGRTGALPVLGAWSRAGSDSAWPSAA